MTMFRRYEDIELGAFDRHAEHPDARYGLPAEVRFCRRCGVSNQRPIPAESEYALTVESKKVTINFDNDSICDACKVWDGKHETIDWEERERALLELCARYRREDGYYDCLVPGSGGKDSVYAAHMLKFKYGMHPLTVTWAPQMYTLWGWRNMQAWIHGGFDNQLFTPNGKVQRLLTRLATETMFHPFQPFVLGQKTFAIKMAIQYGIPLIFFGDHASDWGVALADAEHPDMSYSYYAGRPNDEVFIGGVSLADLKARLGLTDNDLFPYMPVDPQAIERVNPVAHYLGYYLKWHPQGNYYFASEHGFEPSPERTPGTYSKYASIDDKVDDFNFWCYYVKFGVGRATTDASQEVRAKDITLDEAWALIRRYDGEFPERFAEDFFAHISLSREEFPVAAEQFEQPIMDRDYFMHLAERFRSPHIWKWENKSWQLRHVVWQDQQKGSAGPAPDIGRRCGRSKSVRAG